MAADDVLVINHHQANLQVKERTTSRTVVGPVPNFGEVKTTTTTKSVMTISVQSEPIVMMLEEGEVAKRAAEMLAQRIREQTSQISEMVDDEDTVKARAKMERAFYKAKPYAWRRYDGGRTGVTPPRSGERRKFNHSGRLVQSIVAAYVEKTKEWRINFAANRWNPRDWKSQADMQRAFQEWVARVPVLQDASSDMGIQRAIRETFADVMEKQRMGADYRAAKLRGEMIVKTLQAAARVLAA